MKNLFYVFILIIAFQSCSTKNEQNKSVKTQDVSLHEQAIKKIDIHSHYRYDRNYLPELFEKWNLQGVLVDVAIEKESAITRSWDQYIDVVNSRPESFWLCSSLIGTNIDKPDFAETEIIRLAKEIKQGAKMVKVWKNFGMVTTDDSGQFIQIDDERLQPIWDYLSTNSIPVIAHIAEPEQAWRPLDNDRNPHFGYYKDHPEYHAYQHPEIPSYETIIQARDRWIEKNPDLQIMCAHMGSMSHDVNMIADRLDKYPNMYVEPAARFGDLVGQDSDKVRAFFEKYQDRICFGTDYGTNSNQEELTPQQLDNEQVNLDVSYGRLWTYLSSSDTVEIRNQRNIGLDLPQHILHKVYYDNAVTFLDLN